MTLLKDKILIIDFGSQFTQLIARRIRELNVYSEIHPYDVDEQFIRTFNPKGIILSGGPNSVYENSNVKVANFIFALNIPIFGICYGMQTIANELGGEVNSSGIREFGHAIINNLKSDLFDGISQQQLSVWMSHGDKVTKLPHDFEVIANTDSCPIAAFANIEKSIYGVQFHPEVTHTDNGLQLFKNFIFKICKCEATWTMPNYLEDSINKIKFIVKDEVVILALSGGVDSSVAATLIDRAIGKQLVCIFVDTGLLRLNEAQEVMNTYQKHMGLNIIKIDAKERFLQELIGVVDPEAKRKIIGKLFVDIFQEEAKKIPNARFLAQGTIYPDVIESAGSNSKTSHSIKSHHNVGGLPDTLQLKLLEPLRELFKDEVRLLGLNLNLPYNMLYRHPFPGPGLAVRIMGEIKEKFIDLLQKSDAIFIDELKNSGYYDKVAQAFAVFLPVKSVGVMGDGRTYDYVVALRSVETTDFMTANVAQLPFELITKTANRIINEVKGINRVVYDISGKPPSTIEWE
jgi:GMP synthase (glutamine-hydrolysing)